MKYPAWNDSRNLAAAHHLKDVVQTDLLTNRLNSAGRRPLADVRINLRREGIDTGFQMETILIVIQKIAVITVTKAGLVLI